MEVFLPYLPSLLATAVILPLVSFCVILVVGKWLGDRGKPAGWIATSAILASTLLSFFSAGIWFAVHHTPAPHVMDDAHHAVEHYAPPVIVGNGYTLASFAGAEVSINYYIDALTILMFCMVTFIATCIHFYATGYMHEELHGVVDNEALLANGESLRRPGRYARFFQAFSLFCFSMLGLVISGNFLMTFVFWELVGLCSWLLIGFYVERLSASTAANKAFIVNRVGDFGMLIGLMALWASLGTLDFGDMPSAGNGVFAQMRSEENHYALKTPDGMVRLAAADRIDELALASAEPLSQEQLNAKVDASIEVWRDGKAEGDTTKYGYTLLMIAGLGIFCGCVGKSAQLPLHVWLPDAMEGPTPVSALVHSATMVAAGVFLVARSYPIFLPEVLLVIACVGCITLFLGATIALVSTDIKRVLAYSTVSQLGYMMLALGVGGWAAGVMHLITHACFKSLLFLCSGSVIHAVHTNEMPHMGGLIRKMPWTGYTMLVGCLAISGIGLPSIFGQPIGLSGYYSKDAILEQVFSFRHFNPVWGSVFFAVACGGACLTAFYMFRMWYLTFLGEPRSSHKHEHAHESPRTMVVPLVLLAILAVVVAWPIYDWVGLPTLARTIEQARPAGIWQDMAGSHWHVTLPEESKGHTAAVKGPVGLLAFGAAISGILLASVFYLWKTLDPADVRRSFDPLYRVLMNKWYFDEIYQAVFVSGTLAVATCVAWFDRCVIDRLVDGAAWMVVGLARLSDFWIDRRGVDGFVNWFSRRTYRLGSSLRTVQTGSLRQYVMLIVISTVTLFLILSYWTYSLAR
ncbi:NADH-quinone oxidoreductase subunit L [Blastopirellula marina]|uniref:NADH-quinone oxidoreductase subunit L n=1 Tax=Blastopirellula marina TaxID=124 RepID=A0A2S8FEX1_9BACT|nr:MULTISPECIES: NADH-quinone oxidoreductase subunit L [Pirellulaceae]PQO30692.1 NADH-quinone oxidoreductase subunit L [Blastopirellula marina]RCS50829.1 NADH-quinone oxidoreductase subunit L [Bremerella cremea]